MEVPFYVLTSGFKGYMSTSKLMRSDFAESDEFPLSPLRL